MASWPPPPLPARLAAARHLPLVGRDAELATLQDLWTEVERGRRQVLFVGGEPGAGKTRLIAEAAGALSDEGVTVLVGTSSAEGGIPYQPFAEMFEQLFATAPESILAAIVERDAPQLARLTPEVSRHGAAISEPVAGGRELRRDLFDAVARVVRLLADERPLALVLDDLHWAQLPTLALLDHVVHTSAESRLLVLGAFRTTAPDRSDEVAGRIAELHRLEGVRRLDLSGLDTDAIAEYLVLRSGLPVTEARAPAALLRDRTGGNAFFLRELWDDLERRGGVSALRSPQRVPASIGDTLAARISGLGEEVRRVIELAAVLGDTFDLSTLVAASEADATQTMAFIDSTVAVGLIEATDAHGGQYAFVHALTRSAVLDRMPASRLALFHARAAEALERQPIHAALVPQLADHYLAAHVLGFHEPALRYTTQAGRLAESSLAFEDAAAWFERAALLPECDEAQRSELLLAAGLNHVRACHFPEARALYERLALTNDPAVRLAAAMGFEDATWPPGVLGARAADLLTAAIADCGLDHRDKPYVRALGSLGRALALAGETARAREVGDRAIQLATELGDDETLIHALTTSLWHGTSPEMAQEQLERSAALSRLALDRLDYEALGASVNFWAMVSYLVGQPEQMREAIRNYERAARSTGLPYARHIYGCLAHGDAFMRGDFATAERWAEETRHTQDDVDEEMAEGPHAVQMFMLSRERGTLGRFRSYLNGTEAFDGRWVPGLLALYTELGLDVGTRRALHQLVNRGLVSRADEAQWPMELVFMTEAALALDDVDVLRKLRPLLAEYAGMNLVCGTLIAVFGSADRYLGRVAGALGDHAAAQRHFETALTLDRRMGSTAHVAETLAHQSRFAAATGRPDEARDLAREARELAEPIGQGRVLQLLDRTDPSGGPDGLSNRELDVLRLLAGGLSNAEIGSRLLISPNTAANHVRSILMKTGSANRTQAATYAAQHGLV
jgi:DNA-binding CsgD family transcriptional regulator